MTDCIVDNADDGAIMQLGEGLIVNIRKNLTMMMNELIIERILMMINEMIGIK